MHEDVRLTYSRAAHAQFHAKPNPSTNLSPSLHMRKHDAVSSDFEIMSTAAVPVDSSFQKKKNHVRAI